MGKKGSFSKKSIRGQKQHYFFSESAVPALLSYVRLQQPTTKGCCKASVQCEACVNIQEILH